MAKIKIYENYGVLGEEGRSIYAYGGEAVTVVISDELIVGNGNGNSSLGMGL